jgi:hypothetical protein
LFAGLGGAGADGAATDGGVAEGIDYGLGPGGRDLDEGEAVVDVDGADVFTAEAGLVGDGPYEVLGAHAVPSAYGDEEAGHAGFRRETVCLELGGGAAGLVPAGAG